MKKTLLNYILGVAALSVFGSTAQASLILQLTDVGTGTVVTVNDGGVGDANPSAGAVTFVGVVGNFTLNVSTGVVGTTSLDLNSVDQTSAADTLIIMLTNTGYTGAFNSINSQIGGTTQGTVSAIAWIDPTNAAFGHGPSALSTANLGSTSTSPFSRSATSGTIVSTGVYSLTNQVTITTGAGGGITSFDQFTSSVPEPTTLWSAGVGVVLCGLAGLRRRRAELK
jgi:PEP-CTERM motif